MSHKLLLCTVFLSSLLLLKLSNRNEKVIRFNEYLLKFNKSYNDQEYKKRFMYFEASLKKIEFLNSAERATTAKYGLTKFSDWSKDELMAKMTYFGGECNEPCAWKATNWPIVPNKLIARRIKLVLPAISDGLREKVDWRKGDYLGSVQDQKRCNGCWAFGIVGAMESQAAIQGKGFRQLSVQELLDCSDSNDGCNGGNIDQALRFLIRNKFNITTEENYPLKLVTTPHDCKPHPANGTGITDYDVRFRVSDAELMSKIMKGPVIAVINPEPWPYYVEGIIQYNCDECPIEPFLHVVLIVGYDTTPDVPFYIVKNSWGADWGEGGYVRLAMGDDNVCGIRNHVATVDVN